MTASATLVTRTTAARTKSDPSLAVTSSIRIIPPQVGRSGSRGHLRGRRAAHFLAFLAFLGAGRPSAALGAFFASQSAFDMPASARRLRVASENL